MKRCVVLLSGGLDSATTLGIAKSEAYEIFALTFSYGQKHPREVEAAKALGSHYRVAEHKILNIELDAIGGSSLLMGGGTIPEHDSEEIGSEIPSTYVPARNTIMLSYATALAEVTGAEAIFIGANAVDYSGYPDCRPEYIDAFQKLVKLATKRGVEGHSLEIKAPLLEMSKGDIVRKGMELGVPYELTWTCYRGGEKACGTCDSCVLRLRGFKGAGYEDPIIYEVGK